jgi:ABC-type dipeptide/oligopeptide/nickel transport system ATPase component
MTAKEIMSIIDDVKEKLTDDEYLKLSNLLKKQRINENKKRKYKITYIKQTPTIRLDGDIVFQQKIKTKIAHIKDNDYELCCNNLATEKNGINQF